MNSSISFQQCNGLNNLEKHYIQTYTGNLYKPLNLFLLNADTLQTYHHIYPQELAQNLYYLITNRPNSYINGTISYDEERRIVRLIRSKSDNIEWFRHIMFNFTILLYGIILKCPRQQQEVEVYRGVLTHYLREDINVGYFLNTFTSTSMDKQTANSFSKENNNNKIIYHFIVNPDVSYIYIGNSEDEILINPYQLYYFIKKEGAHYFYSIHPSNIILPNNEDKFLDFKKDIMIRTVQMEGGKVKYRELNYTDIISDRRNTRRYNNRKNKNTRRNNNKKQKKLTEKEHFIERMKMPIGTSSFGIPITPEIKADNERIAREYSIYNK